MALKDYYPYMREVLLLLGTGEPVSERVIRERCKIDSSSMRVYFTFIRRKFHKLGLRLAILPVIVGDNSVTHYQLVKLEKATIEDV